jgi:membrane-associated phospholipid phosphatase
LIKRLLSYDHQLFRTINSDWHNPFFNWLMPWLRNSNVWYPLYLFLILTAVINYRKKGWWWVAFAAGTVVLTDFVSSTLIKENIWRLRPCNNPDLSSWINIMVGYRPQSSSFTSSHAANHFGIATFLYLSLKEEFGKWPMLFFLWAFAISYAQVYVGVHYPLDVIAGTGIGLLIGYLTGRLFNKNFGLTIPHV